MLVIHYASIKVPEQDLNQFCIAQQIALALDVLRLPCDSRGLVAPLQEKAAAYIASLLSDDDGSDDDGEPAFSGPNNGAVRAAGG